VCCNNVGIREWKISEGGENCMIKGFVIYTHPHILFWMCS